LYYNGRGVPRDYGQARKWFQRAAKHHLVEGEYAVGLLYDLGAGVQRDEKEAEKWYRKAAEGGYALAQNNLAMLLVAGEGVQHDLKAAAGWFQRAADQGLPQAEVQLGMMLIDGMTGSPDKETGAMWLLIGIHDGGTSQGAVSIFLDKVNASELGAAKVRAEKWIRDRNNSLPGYQEQLNSLTESLDRIAVGTRR